MNNQSDSEEDVEIALRVLSRGFVDLHLGVRAGEIVNPYGLPQTIGEGMRMLSRLCVKASAEDLGDSVHCLSDYYEATIGDVDFDIPGWNWPRCGQSMTLTVGPSGAGKSRWSAAQGVDVVSSDEIRKERSPDGEIRGAQSEIFHEVRMRSAKVLGNGRSVIVDAMHIEPDDRLRQLAIGPADVQKKYALIDRPLSDKQSDGGWRGQKGLVDKYHRLFADHAGAVLAGDGRTDVEVVDLRVQEGESSAG